MQREIQEAWDKISPSIMGQEDYDKTKAFKDFLNSYKSEIILDDFIEMINKASFKFEWSKVEIIQEFLKSSGSPAMTRHNVIEIIDKTGIENDGFKGKIIQDFIKSPKSSTNFDDVVNIIKETDIRNDVVKGNIILEFLKSPKSPPKTTSSQIIKMINEAGIKNDRVKGDIILEFLHSPKSSPEANSSQIIEMINEAGIKDDGEKGNIILEFLRSPKSLAITPKDLANMIKVVGLQNRADLSIILYANKFPSSQNYIKNFIDFIRELHPSEAMQCEFVWKFIQQKKINLGNVNGLKPFIEGLQDNDLALDLIANLSYNGMLENEIGTLSLVKNRSSKQFAFLTEIVGGKALNDCITEDGIINLKAIFGEDLKVGGEPITIGDLISYYDIKGQTTSLSAMLKPEFKKQLRDNFAPSAEILLYKPEELEELNSLMSERGTIFDVKSYFVENAKLCDYLKEKVGPIDAIESAKTYKINFGNFKTPQEKQTELNTLFNELLKSDNPNEEGVAKFFTELFQYDLPEGQNKKNELAIFFQQNKKELAHCFCNENLPKENFTSLLTTLQDGCFANIGTQFTSMLYGVMIKEEDDKVLYGVMSSKIIASIGKNQDINHGQDIGNDGRPLDNERIKAYSLSPMALVENLSKEPILTNEKTWEIIRKNIGDDKKHEIMERLSEKYIAIEESNIEDFTKKSKEIASYLIIKNVVGEEKMKDLESKNPQLKELGDFIYGEVREASIADRTPASPQPSPRILQQQDRDAPQASCFSLFSCLRRLGR